MLFEDFPVTQAGKFLSWTGAASVNGEAGDIERIPPESGLWGVVRRRKVSIGYLLTILET